MPQVIKPNQPPKLQKTGLKTEKEVMALLERFANWIGSLGIRPDQPNDLKRKIRLTNWTILAFIVLCFSYFFIISFLGYPKVAAICVPLTITYCGWALLSGLGYQSLTRLGVLTTFNVAIFTFASTLPGTGVHFYFFASACLPMLFFTSAEPVKMAYGLTLPILGFFFVDLGMLPEFLFSVQVENPELVRRWLMGGNFFAILVPVFSFFYSGAIFQKEIQKQAEQLKDVEAIANIGVWELNPTTHDLYWSDQTYRIHEIPVGSKIDVANAINFYAPSARPTITKAVEKGLQGTPWDLELPFITAKGRRIWVRAMGALRDIEGETRLVGIFQDITQKVKIQNELEDQRERSSESAKRAALGEMAGGIAHEINNPLMIIDGTAKQMTRFMEMNNLGDSPLATQCSKITKMVDRISKIILSMRKLSRDGSDDPKSTILVKDLLDGTLEICREKLNRSGVRLEVDLEDDNSTVLCREVEISQIVLNLVGNAIDAVKDLENRWIKISVTTTSDFTQLKIVDSGSGIEQHIQEKIFNPFFTSKEIGHGTGLGLSLSKKIADQHGGSLYLDSQSQNTCFILKLPTAKSQLKAA